jgi:hydroxypyruvate isomerase
MTSPTIDEDVMMEALKLPTAEELPTSAQRLRSGASMLILDAFDRKVTRDQFLAALGAGVSLIDAIGRHQMLLNVKAFHQDKGVVTNVDIETALHSITQIIETGVSQCTQMAELLRQCPLNEDKVH